MAKQVLILTVVTLAVIILFNLLGCGSQGTTGSNVNADTSQPTPTPTVAPSPPGTHDTTTLIQPVDLEYRGAFRLPDASGSSTWEYGGSAMAYRSDGDPDGPDDGYGGSLFGTGHAQQQHVSEIGIPIPKISSTKSVAALNTASTLQPFANVRAGIDAFDVLTEMVRVGMAYLPKQGDQSTGKLYLAWGAHLQEEEQDVPSHMWCDPDLSHAEGPWRLGNYSPYSVNGYMFDIPEAWATAHGPGKLLATGRFRDGGWGGQGPSLFAIGPWNQGNPPAPGTVLDAVPLLLYSATLQYDSASHVMNSYHHADEWSGGAWLTAGDRSAVIFVGTKGIGNCWYGLPDGTIWPEHPPYPQDPQGLRGWWSTTFVGQIIFYDPADFAKVAQGAMAPHQPQPYATFEVDSHLYRVTSSQQKAHLGGVGFDRQHGLLYVFEPLADGDKPLVHVWAVGINNRTSG